MPAAPRVLFVHDVIGDLGGAEANVRLVAGGLAARSCPVALLHGASTGVGVEKFTKVLPDRFDWSAPPWRGALAAALAWKPDVIYVHKLAHLPLLEALVASGRPLVRMVHDHDMYCQRSYRYFPWNRKICTRKAGYACALTCGVLRDRGGLLPVKFAWPGRKLKELRLCRQFRRHIVVTRFMQGELELHDIPGRTITILPPMPKPAAADHVPQYSEPVVAFVGQIIRGKGVDVLIRACAKLKTPGWKLVIIGEGAHRGECEQVAKELHLGERVSFTGWVPQEELKRHYATVRCGVVPSVWAEPIATIGLELLHHALPVVAFDAGGMKDWLRDGENGFLIPLWDLDTMAERIDRLLGDGALARRLGQNGLAQAKAEYDQERYFDTLRDLLAGEAGLAP